MNLFAAGAAWLERHGHGATVVPHHDADGFSAGVLLARRTGGPVVHLDSPWEGDVTPGQPAVIADWGIRPVTGPTEVLYVDHHAAPERVTGTVVLPPSDGVTSTSLVAWKLLGRPPEGAWLAALGAVGDLGASVLKRRDVPAGGSASALRRLASLVNAPGRLREGPVAVAYGVLARAGSAAEALADTATGELTRALAAVDDSRRRALRAAPAVGPEAALIRISEPARVHSLVASAWARRLAPRPVIAANDRWRDGRVSFAVRSAADTDLRAWLLTRYAPPPGAGDYARGHPGATGGSLAPEAFEAFAEAALGGAR